LVFADFDPAYEKGKDDRRHAMLIIMPGGAWSRPPLMRGHKTSCSTLLMIAFVLGDEKRPKPMPRMTRPVRRKGIEEP